jgi:hypothetical protein
MRVLVTGPTGACGRQPAPRPPGGCSPVRGGVVMMTELRGARA